MVEKLTAHIDARFTALQASITSIAQEDQKIMGLVEADQSVFDDAASAIESLVTAVNTGNGTIETLVAAVNAYLALPQGTPPPAAVLDGLNAAVTDAGTAQGTLTQTLSDVSTAQQALVAATPTPDPDSGQ